MTDEIIREVRRVRHDISRRCDHDPRKVVAYYREFQEAIKQSGEYRFCGETVETDDADPAQANVDTSSGT